jgi:hypothetical protein
VTIGSFPQTRQNPQDSISNQRSISGIKEVAQLFTKPLSVKILRYDAHKNQVNVEMETPGRYLGSKWWLDANSFVH